MIGFILIVCACAFWAIDTLIRYPLMNLVQNSSLIVFYEHFFLSLILLAISFKSWKKFKHIKLKDLPSFFIIGGIGSALATVAFTKAFMFLNPSLVIVLQKFQPVIAIFLASIILKEKINKHFLGWAFLCLIGAFFISYEDFHKVYLTLNSSESRLLDHSAVKGYSLVIFSIIGWGSATVFGKKLVMTGYSDEVIMAGRYVLGFLCLIPFVGTSSELFSHDINIYGKIALMVLISGLLAMYLYYQGLRRIPARLCSLAEMFFPLMAMIVNWIFLNATLSLVQIIGAIILILASVVIQIKRY